jgi:hypothetical protein
MCPRLEKDKWNFGSIGVFPLTEPMHLISILSLQAGHTSSKVWRSLSIPQIYKWKFQTCEHTCTPSKMLPASTINASLQNTGRAKNMGDIILIITISRGAIIKVSTFGIRWCT